MQHKQSSIQSVHKAISKKRKVKQLLAIFFTVFLTLALCLSMVWFSSVFKVKSITVDKIQSIASLQGINSLKNENMLMLNEQEVAIKIYKANPYVKNVVVKKEFPSTLHLSIQLYIPVLYLQVNQGFFLLAGDGRILSKSKDIQMKLPVIHYYQKFNSDAYKTAEKMNFKDIVAALFFLKTAQEVGFNVNSIDITGFNMIALNTNDLKILFTIDKSQTDQAYQLGRVIKQIRMQKKQLKTIDLRFDRVIIES